MLLYLFRRLLFSIATLFIVSLATFSLSYCTSGDPITYDYDTQPAAYIAQARHLGLDKPVFYFSLRSMAQPDTLHRILPIEMREHLRQILRRWGNWPALDRHWKAVEAIQMAFRPRVSGEAMAALVALRFARSPQGAQSALVSLDAWVESLTDTAFKAQARQLLTLAKQAQLTWAQHPQHWKTLVPVLQWHGTDNRYHRWIMGFLQGDPGVSVVTGNPLVAEIRPRFYATLLVSGGALLFAYVLGVPWGIWMARWRGHWFEGSMRMGVLFLYAMPVIWIGSVLTLLLARPDIGLGWIRGGAAEPWLLSGKSFWHWYWDNADRFLLPMLTLALHYGAVVALQMRTGMVEALDKDFIRTARAKGLSEKTVFWRHAFREGLFPLITTFGLLFPVLLGGSLVVEYLFDFPGMGVKMQTSFAQHDYPVLFAMVMFIAAVTLVGMFLADVLYAWADPRVRIGAPL
ncbi:MAG: ABC transporter permease [Saprospiraceae bacterium]|nr:ABC transporter permease [Saprospiraceae bacterium]MDW8482738.1 ABC transporter permease [Saprospiraceae bacterium]